MNTEIVCAPGSDVFEVSNASSGNTYPQEWFFDWASAGTRSDSGAVVNGYTALTHCPLWQGVNIIAGDIGQVPIRLVRDEFFDQRQHNAWQLLRVRPNALQTVSVWLETMIQWALIWGNGVSWTPRRSSRITDLIPLRPDCLWPELVSFDDGQVLLYHYQSPTTNRRLTLFPDEVVHIQGLTSDGVWGYALHEIAKNCIGQGLALEKHGNRTFRNGARPSGVLEHPAILSPEARSNLRSEWEAVHSGADNAGRIAILWEGMKFNSTTMTNLDAQWIEAKKMSRIDAASLLNLPAHKLNALEDSSVRSNLEEQNETYKQMALTRWATRLDQEFRRKLLTDSEWRSDSFRFLFDWDEFLRADIDTLTQVGDRAVKAEIMNRNEARRMIGLPPYPGGEKFGSPAINPQPETASPEEDEDDDDEDAQARVAAMHALLLDRIGVFLRHERESILQAAKESPNFLNWLDEFYFGSDGPPRAMSMCEKICGSSIVACKALGVSAEGLYEAVKSRCADQHRRLLALTESVTQERLLSAATAFADADDDSVSCALLRRGLETLEPSGNGSPRALEV